MKTYNYYLLPLICILSIFFISSCYPIKVQTPNSVEVCELQKHINNMLIQKYNEDIYKKTGIVAFVTQNSIVITSLRNYIEIDGDEIFKHLHESLLQIDENVDFNNIRYFIISNVGYTLAYTGKDLQANIKNLDSLNKYAIRLSSSFNYSQDPDFKTITRLAFQDLRLEKSYGSTRQKHYESVSRICVKQ